MAGKDSRLHSLPLRRTLAHQCAWLLSLTLPWPDPHLFFRSGLIIASKCHNLRPWMTTTKSLYLSFWGKEWWECIRNFVKAGVLCPTSNRDLFFFLKLSIHFTYPAQPTLPPLPCFPISCSLIHSPERARPPMRGQQSLPCLVLYSHTWDAWNAIFSYHLWKAEGTITSKPSTSRPILQHVGFGALYTNCSNGDIRLSLRCCDYTDSWRTCSVHVSFLTFAKTPAG